MFALVDKSDNSITRMLSGSQGITLDGIQHPKAIFSLWTEAERNAINIYTVEINNSKRKNTEWYVNTGTEENPIIERPLGELPTLES